MLSLLEARDRVIALLVETPVGSRFDGMRMMFERAGLDRDEAFAAISGLSDGVPSPLTGEQHEALLTALMFALLTGYEVGKTAD